VLGLDQYAPFLLSAFGITLLVLVGYLLYLRSRLTGARRRAAALDATEAAYSARNVAAAAPRATTAQAASSANGPSSA
jgi:predicted lipid-binding transport protein (Tim44 family)